MSTPSQPKQLQPQCCHAAKLACLVMSQGRNSKQQSMHVMKYRVRCGERPTLCQALHKWGMLSSS
jgi:hypothetical protein